MEHLEAQRQNQILTDLQFIREARLVIQKSMDILKKEKDLHLHRSGIVRVTLKLIEYIEKQIYLLEREDIFLIQEYDSLLKELYDLQKLTNCQKRKCSDLLV